MLLIGMFDSPFVRRVAISMKLLGLSFEHANWSVGKDFDRIRQYNPLGRVPTLVLDDARPCWNLPPFSITSIHRLIHTLHCCQQLENPAVMHCESWLLLREPPKKACLRCMKVLSARLKRGISPGLIAVRDKCRGHSRSWNVNAIIIAKVTGCWAITLHRLTSHWHVSRHS